MASQIEKDIQYLHTIQRRILDMNVDDPRVKQCLDRAYAGAKQAIEALDELDNLLLNMLQEVAQDGTTLEPLHDRQNEAIQLPIGQRLKLTHPDAPTVVEYGTVRGYTDEGEMLVRFDNQRYSATLGDWQSEVIPNEVVSHWQVWDVSRDRLVQDGFETPGQAEAFAKQEKKEAHQIAARHDDYVPPPQFEVRAVPMGEDRHE